MISWWRKLDTRGKALLLAIILLMICLFQPHMKLPKRVYDWLIVIDITQSMNVRDMSINDRSISRLAFSKASIRESLRALPCGSRVALGLFTERNTTTITHPLEVCTHFSAIDETVSRVDWRMAWAADSFISHGLFDGIAKTAKIDDQMNIAFITDGHQAPPGNPDYMPKFEGKTGQVKGLIVGVGGLKPSLIPKLDDKDNITGYWELDDVQRYATFGMARVQSALEMEQQQADGMHGRNAPHGSAPTEVSHANLSGQDQASLKKLANETRLNYLNLQEVNQLNDAFSSRKTSVWRMADTDLRPWFAIPAMCLIILFFIPATFLNQLFQRVIKRKRK
jgi:mxaL protein